MTALCGGGTSAPKVGTALAVEYSAGLIAELLIGLGSPWLIPVIPLMGLGGIVLSTFCGSDPPAMPTFTQAEVDALLHLTFGADFNSGLPKLGDLYQNLVWNDACHCTSGVYAPALPPAQPAGSTTVVYARPPIAAACAIQDLTFIAEGGGHHIFGGTSVPSGHTATALLISGTNTVNAAPGYDPQVAVRQYTRLGVLQQTDFVNTVPGAAFSAVLSIAGPQPFAGFTTAFENPILGGTSDIFVHAAIYCDGTPPGGTLSPCCPPDPATDATLQALLRLVTDMQRNYQPFGYVLGAAHAGLTGTGSVPVSRLLGVKVALTSIPGGAVTLPGNPGYIKDMGWMSVSEVDGMLQEHRISQAAFTWFPPYMPLADHINYFLDPGVVATFTELKPEP